MVDSPAEMECLEAVARKDVLKMSDINFEQRCAIRFCFRLGDRRETIENEQSSGRSSSSRTVDRILDLVFRSSIDNNNDRGRVKFNSHYQILTNELGTRKNLRQKGSKKPFTGTKMCLDISTEMCLDFLESIENEPHFMKLCITVPRVAGRDSIEENSTLESPKFGVAREQNVSRIWLQEGYPTTATEKSRHWCLLSNKRSTYLSYLLNYLSKSGILLVFLDSDSPIISSAESRNTRDVPHRNPQISRRWQNMSLIIRTIASDKVSNPQDKVSNPQDKVSNPQDK
ncbi:hypothetical protein NQ318_007106, partial [Aromia moschata]